MNISEKLVQTGKDFVEALSDLVKRLILLVIAAAFLTCVVAVAVLALNDKLPLHRFQSKVPQERTN